MPLAPPLFTFTEVDAFDTTGVVVVVAALVVHVVIAEDVRTPLLLYVVKIVTVVKIVLVRVVVDVSDELGMGTLEDGFGGDDPVSDDSPLYEHVAKLLLVAGIVPFHIPP